MPGIFCTAGTTRYSRITNFSFIFFLAAKEVDRTPEKGRHISWHISWDFSMFPDFYHGAANRTVTIDNY